MWSDQIFSSCKSAIYDYETLTFTAAQKRTLIAEIHLSWHTGQYDIKVWIQSNHKFFFLNLNHPWWAKPPGCSKCFKNFVWLWKFNIYCIYSSARVCNKASIIEPTTNVFLSCWKFITLCKLTQLSLLFKVIKHLE